MRKTLIIILFLLCGIAQSQSQDFGKWRFRFPTISKWLYASSDVIVSAPDVPTLLTPADNTNDLSLTPTLDWSNSTGATTYGVQLDGDGTFASPIISQLALASSQYIAPGATLLNGTYYAWRTRATNSGGNSAWAPGGVGYFLFSTTMPAISDVGRTPANNATGISLTPTLDWSDVDQTGGYFLTVIDFSTATIIDNEDEGPTSNYVWGIADLIRGGTYTWSVIAVSTQTVSSVASSTFTFTCIQLSAPTLTAPTNHNITIDPTSLDTYDWNSVTGATTYRLEVNTASDFSGTVMIDDNNANPGSISIVGAPLTKYYWRVTAINEAGEGLNHSAVWDYTTILF